MPFSVRKLPFRRAVVVFLLAAFAMVAVSTPGVRAQDLPSTLYTIEGYVYDGQAKPLEGAVVAVRPSGGGAERTATTGSAGQYSLAQVAAGTYNVTASAPGLEPSFVPVRVAGAAARIQQSFLLRDPDQVVFGQPMSLKGTVSDETDGAPMSGVLIEVWNYYYPSSGYENSRPYNTEQHFTVRSGADGSYSLTLSEGSVGLTARHDGYDILHANFEIRADRELDLPMRESQGQSVLVSGTVKDEDGSALADAWVSVQPDWRCGDGSEYGCPQPAIDSAEPVKGGSSGAEDVYFYYEPGVSPYNSTTTDRLGRYELRTTPGRILVMANAADHAQDQQTVEAEGGENKTVNFVLERIPPDSVRVHGRVVDAESGDGIPYAQLNLENQAWGHWNYTQTDEDGSFEFRTKPGYTLVTASAYQHYWTSCEVEPSSGGAEPGSTGAASSGDSVRAAEPYPCDGSRERDREYMPRVLVFSGTPDEDKVLDFKLLARPLPDATFQGYVVNASSEEAVPGATVSFYNELTRDWGQAVTDENGSYKIRVHGGYYTVRAYADGYFDAALNPEIESGETQRLDILMEPGEKRYGYCCVAYASESGAKGGPSGAPAPMATTAPAGGPGMGAAPRAEGQGDAAAAGSPDGNEAYFGSGGGLGRYSGPERGSGAGAPGATVAVVALAAGLAVALWRRRAA